MGSRPLRHYYSESGIQLTVDPALGDVVEPWLRHRERFEKVLGSLTEDQWLTQSRCTAWTNRDVISHLVDVDAFWALSLEAGRSGEPTSYLRDFDPKATPLALVDSKSSLTTAEIFDSFTTNAGLLRTTVEAFDASDWNALCEAPIGHVSARVTLAHALWDSWLHERDVLFGLDLVEDSEADELAVVAWYSLLFGGAQGGVIDDPEPVGPGATAPLDVQLQFDDLPDAPLRLVVDTGVLVGRADSPMPAGSAAQFVEALTGRADTFPPDGVTIPSDAAAQFDRARDIL